MSANLESQIQSAEQEWMEHYKQGPTRLRWTEIPPQVKDTAPDIEMGNPSPKHCQFYATLALGNSQ